MTGSTSCRWVSSSPCTSPLSRSARSSPGRHTSADLPLLAWAFTLFALAEVSYITYHLDWTVFLFAHTIAEVLDLVAFVLVFAAAVARVAEPRRAASLETGGA